MATKSALCQRLRGAEAVAEETKPAATPEPAEPAAKPAAKKAKPPKLEDKPFGEFIEQHYLPALKDALSAEGLADVELIFSKEPIDVAGAEGEEDCWQVTGKWGDRQFCLYFLEESINGSKAFTCVAGKGARPSTLESFMIDERRVTLDLLVLFTLKRLNGQKWLSRN